MAGQKVLTIPATIANGQTVGIAVSLGDNVPTGIITPAAIDGTSLTFQGSVDGTNYYPIYDTTNTQVSVTIGTSRIHYLTPANFAGLAFLKLVGTQSTADRAYLIIARFI